MSRSIIIYAITFIISIFFGWVYQNKAKTKIGKFFSFLGMIVPPLFVSTFRYNVGVDYKNYELYYNIINFQSRYSVDVLTFESGFIFINKIAALLFNSSRGFFFLSSLTFLLFSFIGIIRYKEKISMPLSIMIFLVFFYSPSFNGIRQLIAVSIVFFALKYAFEKRIWKYLIFIIIASFFHRTALICLLLYFLVPSSKEKYKDIDLKFDIVIAFFIILTPFIGSVLKYLQQFIPLINRYSSYISATGDKNVYFLLYILPPLLILLLYKKNYLKDDIKNLFYIRLMILQIPFQFLGAYVPFLDRLSLYVSISQLITLPRLVNIVSKDNKKIIELFIVLWYIFYYCVVYIYLNANGVYPYTFSFS